jgi:O-antigen/teichoic acid export membrane protein
VFYLPVIRAKLLHLDPIQRQSLISGFVTLTITVLGFFSTVYFAHTVGASVLGFYFIFLAYFSLFNFIGDGGFGGAANKRLSEGKEKNALLSAYFTIKLTLLVVSLVFFILARPILPDFQVPEIQVLTAVALILCTFSDCAMTGVYGRGKLGITQLSMLLNNLIRILIQICAVFLGFGIFGLVGGFILGMLCGTIFNMHYLDFDFTSFTQFHVRSLSSYAIWSFLSSGGLLIFSYADTILIAYFLNTADVAIYRTAFNLTAMTGFAVLSFQYVLFPRISSWWTSGNNDNIRSTVSLAIHFSLALAIPFCVGGWILGDRLLYFLYGSSFSSGYIALFILLFVQIVNVFMLMLTTTLNALNRPDDTFKVTLITSVLLIILDVLLIPVFGISGAAISVLITFFLNAVLTYYILEKVIKIPLNLNELDKILLSTFIMGISLLIYREFIPLSNVFVTLSAVLIGSVIYTLILLTIEKRVKNQLLSILIQSGFIHEG